MSKSKENGVNCVNGVSALNGVDGDNLVSNERLSCDSPVMWPDQNFCKSITEK